MQALAEPGLAKVQSAAASQMLSLVDRLEEELFAAEARRYDTEACCLPCHYPADEPPSHVFPCCIRSCRQAS